MSISRFNPNDEIDERIKHNNSDIKELKRNVPCYSHINKSESEKIKLNTNVTHSSHSRAGGNVEYL